MYNLRSMSLTRQCTFSVCILLFLQCMYLAAATVQEKETMLQKLFEPAANIDWQLADKILQATSQLEEGIKKAGDASTAEEGVKILDQYFSAENAHLALNKKRALELKDQYLESIRQEQERLRRIRAIKDIRVTTGDGGQLVINKYVNRNNKWFIILLPVSVVGRDIKNISGWFANGKEAAEMAAFAKKEKEKYEYSSPAVSLKNFKIQNQNEKEASTYTNGGIGMLNKLKTHGLEFELNQSVCSLSNITCPVFIIVREHIWNGTASYVNFWYTEYNPSQGGNVWNINSVPY